MTKQKPCGVCKGIVFDGGECRGCDFLSEAGLCRSHARALVKYRASLLARKKKQPDGVMVALDWAITAARRKANFWKEEAEACRGD